MINIRKTKNMSQEMVAGLDLSVRNYQKIEKGETFPSFKSIVIISNNLNVHPGKLFDLPSLKSLNNSQKKAKT
nr:helix-turn-helix transcriptional regulator [Leptospira mtsangambouensis]